MQQNQANIHGFSLKDWTGEMTKEELAQRKMHEKRGKDKSSVPKASQSNPYKDKKQKKEKKDKDCIITWMKEAASSIAQGIKSTFTFEASATEVIQ